MKKILFSSLLSCLMLLSYSCSSDDLPTASVDELHEVTFNISNFTSETSDMTTRASLVDAKVKYLRYVVINKETKIVTDANTIDGTAIASPLKLKLKKGKYTICFFASENPITTDDVQKPSGSIINQAGNTSYREGVMINNLSNPNLYQGSADFDVISTDLQKNVELKRPIGKITLALSDLAKIPDDVQTLIPILIRSRSTVKVGEQSLYLAPAYIGVQDGASVYKESAAFNDIIPITNNPYPSIYINKSKFNTISESSPFNFYLPQTTNVNLVAATSSFPSNEIRYDLYLQGSKTNKMEFQLVSDDSAMNNNPKYKNNNVVFMVCLKKGITIKPNEQITIKGKLFNDSSLSVVVNNVWNETINTNF